MRSGRNPGSSVLPSLPCPCGPGRHPVGDHADSRSKGIIRKSPWSPTGCLVVVQGCGRVDRFWATWNRVPAEDVGPGV